jgi:hypothetical protein
MQSLSPDALVERFLAREIPPREFTHEMHVAVGWALLRRMPYPEALAAYAATIRAMAESVGAAEKFNITITAAFLALIAEHLAEDDALAWPAFIAANPALLDKSLLARWYSPERLRSPLARATFVMPEPAR